MDAGTEIAGGWVAVKDGLVVGVGAAGHEPPAHTTLRADSCLVTPGLVNTHHHIYQNLTRWFGPLLAPGCSTGYAYCTHTGPCSTKKPFIFRHLLAWQSLRSGVARQRPTTSMCTQPEAVTCWGRRSRQLVR